MKTTVTANFKDTESILVDSTISHVSLIETEGEPMQVAITLENLIGDNRKEDSVVIMFPLAEFNTKLNQAMIKALA